MNFDPRVIRDDRNEASRSRRRRSQPRQEEEELETGEPIPGEGEPIPSAKKIPGLRGRFDGRPSGQTASVDSQTDQAEPSHPGNGQMVLSSAKYLKTKPAEPESRKGGKDRCDPAQENHERRSFEGRVLNAGVGGGMLAMAGAVVWFVLGLMGGVFFFYPPILFIIGLVAFLKGLAREG